MRVARAARTPLGRGGGARDGAAPALAQRRRLRLAGWPAVMEWVGAGFG